MFLATILFLALAAQQPAQQPAAAPKPQANAAQQTDTAKAKHQSHRSKRKAKKSSSTSAPKDTTKSKP